MIETVEEFSLSRRVTMLHASIPARTTSVIPKLQQPGSEKSPECITDSGSEMYIGFHPGQHCTCSVLLSPLWCVGQFGAHMKGQSTHGLPGLISRR